MTFFGWLLGSSFQKIIDSFDHWVAFSLLVFIGGKMIYETFNGEKKNDFKMQHKTLLILAIATSIDAFGIGLSFALLEQSIMKPSVIIGIVSFILSIVGVYTGKSLQKILGKKAEFLGGIILIGIGMNILLKHGFLETLNGLF